MKGRPRKYENMTREEFIQRMGGKCVRCGFDDWRALQVDHVDGDGALERSHPKYSGNSLRHFHVVLAAVALGSKRYQVLCANCNWIKRYERGETRK